MMLARRDAAFVVQLVQELQRLPREMEWAEFKRNNSDPDEIGGYISAIANAAAINGREVGYVVWGIDNDTHDVVGTTFSPSAARKGNEPLETWLVRLVSPSIEFRFHEVAVDDKNVVLLEIHRAFRHPVRFKKEAYIRVGSVKKPLREVPDRERALWRVLEATPFEKLVAAERISSDDVLRLLDYPTYFDLLGLPLPPGRTSILEALQRDELINPCDAGGWDITHLGATLFAKEMDEFPTIARKTIRVVQYSGNDRTSAIREHEGTFGYASGFEGMIDFVNGLLPTNEVMGRALRKTVPMFPELAVRELVANALIHQDFLVRGAGPMVEIFEGRLEITSPGEPLIEPERFVDSPPRSRNEELASMMRRLGICEERGSGIDKVVSQVELHQLPAPLFEVASGSTRAVLFAHKPLAEMDKTEKVRACYLHACLQYVTRSPMTNASLRKRFGITSRNAALASRVLNETVAEGLIVLRDPNVGTKSRSYLPHWAAPNAERRRFA